MEERRCGAISIVSLKVKQGNTSPLKDSQQVDNEHEFSETGFRNDYGVEQEWIGRERRGEEQATVAHDHYVIDDVAKSQSQVFELINNSIP